MDKFRQFGSIISVITDAILARCMSSPQPPGENRVGREPEPQVFFFTPKYWNYGDITVWYSFVFSQVPCMKDVFNPLSASTLVCKIVGPVLDSRLLRYLKKKTIPEKNTDNTDISIFFRDCILLNFMKNLLYFMQNFLFSNDVK
jgi:hypothetical protein